MLLGQRFGVLLARPALAGGFVTAVCFLAWLWLCARLQVGVIKYSKLYGGFAIIPILLAWVYTSNLILLYGANFSAQFHWIGVSVSGSAIVSPRK